LTFGVCASLLLPFASLGTATGTGTLMTGCRIFGTRELEQQTKVCASVSDRRHRKIRQGAPADVTVALLAEIHSILASGQRGRAYSRASAD
jgi:hypothetical protein